MVPITDLKRIERAGLDYSRRRVCESEFFAALFEVAPRVTADELFGTLPPDAREYLVWALTEPRSRNAFAPELFRCDGIRALFAWAEVARQRSDVTLGKHTERGESKDDTGGTNSADNAV